MMLLPLLIN
ncbi:unnamed protein product [Callosobruchus maculatus]|uniref:Uncharacterized protein n=1 Tax=Callosobruchus maculatus TaxID=64391 RepID=A0A653D210_CALMS|nr:unnamed protein product [Callosobruchus maculatus]